MKTKSLTNAATALKRMFINQPSTLQPYHALDGQRVLAADIDFLLRRLDEARGTQQKEEA